MDVDWWHVATVAVLALALGCELLGAYCAQKQRFRDEDLHLNYRSSPLHWLFLYRTEGTIEPYWTFRFAPLTPAFGSFARGFGRLAVAALFLVLFAFDQSLPILGKLS